VLNPSAKNLEPIGQPLQMFMSTNHKRYRRRIHPVSGSLKHVLFSDTMPLQNLRRTVLVEFFGISIVKWNPELEANVLRPLLSG